MPGTEGRTAAAGRLTERARTRTDQAAPLWQCGLAFGAGNLSLHQLPVVPGPAWLLLLTIAALALLARCGLRAVCCLPCVWLLGFCWTAAAANHGLSARWPVADDGRDIAVSGWIDSQPQHDEQRTVFSLHVTEAATAVPLRRIRLSWYEPRPALEAGQRLVLEARLRTPRGLVNPGGFDYERWLFLESYDATGYVRDGQIVRDGRRSLARRWLAFRSTIAARLGGIIDGTDAAALVKALSLGERSDFSDDHWAVLQRTGTSHLVAVSGLHVGLVAAMAWLIVLRIWLLLPYALARHAHLAAALGCIVPAAAYAALAGFALPTQRALVMLLVAQLALVSRRRWPVSGGLALALIAVLMLDPLASLSASFWLSFGAVALLLTVASGETAAVRNSRRRIIGRIGAYVRLQWALTLGLAPLVIWFFDLVSPASLFVNLLAIPVFSLILVPLSLLTVLAVLAGVGAAPVASLTSLVADGCWRGLELAASHPFAAYPLPHPPLPVILLALAAVAMFVPRHRLPGRRLALLGLLPLACDHGVAIEPGEARVTVLDVGQGLAVVIETATHRLLYDAGPVYRSGFDAGAEIVAPALVALDRTALDMMIISHADTDHAGGAAAVMRRYPDLRLLGGPDLELGAEQTCVAGQQWVWDQIGFSILHPAVGFAPEGNESSCVLRVAANGWTLLLTGDIERRAEYTLTRQSAALASDVVIVPHHGSRTSSTETFVVAVDADIAVVSAGFNNRWGFPLAQISNRWLQSGARLLVTGDTGAITIDLQAEVIRLTAARAVRRRYWQPKRDLVSGAIEPSAL